MRIDELIERLEECRDELGGETEVRFMSQPSWPFEYEIAGLTTVREIRDQDGEDELESFDPQGDEPDVVYLVEGTQLGYGSKTAWTALR